METILFISAGLIPSLVFITGMMLLWKTRGGYDVFEPLTFVFLNTFLGVTARSVYFVLSPVMETPLLLDAEEDTLLLAQLFAILASVAVTLGYFLARGRNRDSGGMAFLQRRLRPSMGTWFFLIGVCVISLVGAIGFGRSVGFTAERIADYSSKRAVFIDGVRMNYGYMRWVATLSLPALLLTLIVMIDQKCSILSHWTPLLGGACLMSIGWAVFTSSRTSLMLVALQVGVASYYLVRRVRGYRSALFMRWLRWGIPVLGLFLLMGTLRANRDSHADLRESVGLRETIDKIVGSGNFFGVAKTSIVLRQVPARTGFLYGESLITWITAPIPRALWPGKPDVVGGFRFGEEVLGYDMSKLQNGKTMSLPVELYWNFGWLGVTFGMLLFGFVLGKFYAFFSPMLRQHAPAAIALYASVVYPIAMSTMNNSLSVGITKTIQQGITVCIMLVFVTRSVRNEGDHTFEDLLPEDE